MKQVICRSLTEPPDLQVVEVSDPVARAGEVLVELTAAGVNFADGLLASGRHQGRPETPYVPGSEGAGTIAALGPDVTGWEVGDEVVFGIPRGAFAERLVVPAGCIYPRPVSLDPATAATCTQTYGAVFHALQARGHVQRGETILVLGAGGGIGQAAVVLGLALGAEVLAVASSREKLGSVAELGVTKQVVYAPGSLREQVNALCPGGVDVVVDPVGGDPGGEAHRCLRRGGRHLVLGFASGSVPKVALNHLLVTNRTVSGIAWDGAPDDIRSALALLEKSGLRIPPATSHRFAEAGQVIADLLERRTHGRHALVPD